MFGRIALGFLAAAIAVLVCHQPVVYLLNAAGFVPFKPYNMDALKTAPTQLAALMTQAGFKGWPTVFNQVFWGGLWGVLFAFVHPILPGRLMLLKGIVFGLLVLLISNWTLLPLMRGEALFAGLVPARMFAGLCILSAFGAGTGFFYGLLRRT
jgi:hypothetical protein